MNVQLFVVSHYILLIGIVAATSSFPHLNTLFDPVTIISPSTVCGNMPGLTKSQSVLCKQNPHAVASAVQGLQVAIHECKRQFKNHRWNCSSLETKNKIPHTSRFLSRGFKESAFSYAITSAGVAHKVAQACSLGRISDCACQPPMPKLMSAGQRKKFKKLLEEGEEFHFHQSGCDHDINFAINFSSKFLDPRKSQQDIAARTMLHNNRVGRLIVANNMKRACKCHGMSGACSQETCWSITPSFKEVGKKIKQKYENAATVDKTNINSVRASRRQHSADSATARVSELQYYERSPNYCNPRPNVAIAGTRGRYCNHTAPANDPSSCDNLCCGRGAHPIKHTRVEKCRCRFHWCCYVECDTCTWPERLWVCN